MRRATAYFEQIPVSDLKHLLGNHGRGSTVAVHVVESTPPVSCRICRNPVLLESAKANEDGHAVHEECYVGHVLKRQNP
jgi:hypothetical protein